MNLRCITKEPFELPSEILSYLESKATIETFKKNEILILPGSKNSPWFFISAGLARLYLPSTNPEQPDTTILFGEAGNIATSLPNFMLDLPSVMGVQAVTPLKAYKVSSDIIRELYHNEPIFCRWLAELSMIQIAHLEIRTTYFMEKDPYERFLNFIRFKPKSYMRRVPGYMLASYLSISLNDFFKAKEKYENDNLRVEYDKEFLDKVGLTGFAPEE